MNRAQHSIPQAYLRSFLAPSHAATRNKYLWVYEKGKEPRHARPEKVAHERDYYSFVAKGKRQDLVDEYLGTLESSIARLREFAERSRFQREDDKRLLAELIGLMSARVPAARNLASDIAGESATDELREAAENEELFRLTYERLAIRLKEPLSTEEVRERLIRGDRFKDVSKVNSLLRMLDMGRKNADQLWQMSWTVWRSPADELFVTSDNPVVSVFPDGRGLAEPGVAFAHASVQIVFPLNPRACLFAARHAVTPGKEVPATWVRRVNKVVMAMADRWLFAAENSRKIKELFDEVGGSGMYADDFYEST